MFLKLTRSTTTAVNGSKLLKGDCDPLEGHHARKEYDNRTEQEKIITVHFLMRHAMVCSSCRSDNNKDDLRFKDVNKAAEQLLADKKEA